MKRPEQAYSAACMSQQVFAAIGVLAGNQAARWFALSAIGLTAGRCGNRRTDSPSGG